MVGHENIQAGVHEHGLEKSWSVGTQYLAHCRVGGALWVLALFKFLLENFRGRQASRILDDKGKKKNNSQAESSHQCRSVVSCTARISPIITPMQVSAHHNLKQQSKIVFCAPGVTCPSLYLLTVCWHLFSL